MCPFLLQQGQGGGGGGDGGYHFQLSRPHAFQHEASVGTPDSPLDYIMAFGIQIGKPPTANFLTTHLSKSNLRASL